jgi:hypothetical protein
VDSSIPAAEATGTGSFGERALTFLKRWWVLLAIIGVVVLSLLMFIGYRTSVKNELVDRGTQLSAEYQSNQNELDTYVKTIKEQLGVANVKSDRLDTILKDAVSGRYDSAITATPGSQAQAAANPLISAIVEAYPQLDGLDIYDKIVDSVKSGREAFKQKQNVLLDKVRQYRKYRNTGFFRPMVVGMVGYPELEARIGTEVKTGKAALDQMQLIVTSGGTSDAFRTGEDEPIEIEP